MLDTSILKRNWRVIFREVKERWPGLTQADFEFVDGDMDKLVKVVQKRLHVSDEEARRDVDDFLHHLDINRNIA